MLLGFKTIKGCTLCLTEAVSTPGNLRGEMSTAGTGNGAESLSGRELGWPATNQEQNFKGRAGANCLQTEAQAPQNSATRSEVGQGDHSHPFCLEGLLPAHLESFEGVP